MTCPNCGEHDNQMWHSGYVGGPDQPDEPAYLECGYCGYCYEDDPGDYIDYAYETLRERPYDDIA